MFNSSKSEFLSKELNSLERGAGIKYPGKKRLTMVSLEHVPMGLNFSSKNEFGCQR
jgi:hypothetical protein